MADEIWRLVTFTGVTCGFAGLLALATILGQDAVIAERGWQDYLIKIEKLGTKSKKESEK